MKIFKSMMKEATLKKISQNLNKSNNFKNWIKHKTYKIVL